MAKEYSTAEAVEHIASGLIPNHHPELATARVMYCFVSTAGTRGGVDVMGRARKISGFTEWAIEQDFVIEVALDKWNDLGPAQRVALVDHLLERCTAEEDEKTGDLKFRIREPNVSEFTSILQRHGAWNDTLTEMVSIAQTIELDQIVAEEADIDVADLVEQKH
jgi:Putative phage metallopeptidase